MADLTPAKAGDKLTDKARKKLAQALFGQWNVSQAEIDSTPLTVEPKAAGDRGQWVCIDCGALPQHNIDAWNHAEQHKKHRFAWRNFVTGNIEAP